MVAVAEAAVERLGAVAGDEEVVEASVLVLERLGEVVLAQRALVRGVLELAILLARLAVGELVAPPVERDPLGLVASADRGGRCGRGLGTPLLVTASGCCDRSVERAQRGHLLRQLVHRLLVLLLLLDALQLVLRQLQLHLALLREARVLGGLLLSVDLELALGENLGDGSLHGDRLWKGIR